MVDQRKESILGRLVCLTTPQLQRFIDAVDSRFATCYDTWNYDDANNSYCPISIMLDVPEILQQRRIKPTQEVVLQTIKEEGEKVPGFVFGTVKDIPGTFYTNDREGDVYLLCKEILAERHGREPNLTAQ